MEKVKARKDAVVAQSRDRPDEVADDNREHTLVRGHARFTGPHAVEVGGEAAGGALDLHQCRRACPGAADPGLDQVPG